MFPEVTAYQSRRIKIAYFRSKNKILVPMSKCQFSGAFIRSVYRSDCLQGPCKYMNKVGQQTILGGYLWASTLEEAKRHRTSWARHFINRPALGRLTRISNVTLDHKRDLEAAAKQNLTLGVLLSPCLRSCDAFGPRCTVFRKFRSGLLRTGSVFF